MPFDDKPHERPIDQFVVEYVWIGVDGHTKAFTRTFNDENEARTLVYALEADKPDLIRASKATCEGCDDNPARIVCVLRKGVFWPSSGRLENATEIVRWEDPEHETLGEGAIAALKAQLKAMA